MQATNASNQTLWLGLTVALAAGWCALAQEASAPYPDVNSAPPPSAPPLRSAAELQKLAEPIALYPDPLISIVLPASVYPLEIVEAARFVRNTNNIPNIDAQAWDQNVKSVAKFPEVIAMMDEKLSWTAALGQAFVDQQKDLMDAIQTLRGLAQKAGTLQTTPQQIVYLTNTVIMVTNTTQVVQETKQIIEIIPSSPTVVYVPIYPPTVYYPPPAYVYNPLAPLVTFGVGVAVGAIIANNCNWWRGGIYVGPRGGFVWGGSGYYRGNVNVNVNNFNRNVNVNNSRNVNVNNSRNLNANVTQQWQPDQNRMRTSGSGTASASTREARGWGSGTGQTSGTRPSTGAVGTRPSTGNVGTGPSTGTIGARPSTGAVGTRPSTGNVGAQPSTGAGGARPSTGTVAANRPTTSQTANRSAPSTSTFQNSPSTSRSSGSSSAFSGVNNGSAARDYSSRGSYSRGSSGGGSSGGGMGGARGGGRR